MHTFFPDIPYFDERLSEFDDFSTIAVSSILKAVPTLGVKTLSFVASCILSDLNDLKPLDSTNDARLTRCYVATSSTYLSTFLIVLSLRRLLRPILGVPVVDEERD